jgi:hypothetical protein
MPNMSAPTLRLTPLSLELGHPVVEHLITQMGEGRTPAI